MDDDLAYFTLTIPLDDTGVTIYFNNGTTEKFTFQSYQRLEIMSRANLGGTDIQAMDIFKPIMATSGNMRSRFQTNQRGYGRDNIIDTLIDNANADVEFHWMTSPRPNGASGVNSAVQFWPDFILILTIEDGTEAKIQNQNIHTAVNMSWTVEIASAHEAVLVRPQAGPGMVTLKTNKPVLLYTYVCSGGSDTNPPTDPSMSAIPGRTKWTHYYVVSQPLRSDGSLFSNLYLLLAAEQTIISAITLASYNQFKLKLNYFTQIQNESDWLGPFDGEVIKFRKPFTIIGYSTKVYTTDARPFVAMYFGAAKYESFFTPVNMNLGYALYDAPGGFTSMEIFTVIIHRIETDRTLDFGDAVDIHINQENFDAVVNIKIAYYSQEIEFGIRGVNSTNNNVIVACKQTSKNGTVQNMFISTPNKADSPDGYIFLSDIRCPGQNTSQFSFCL